MKISQSYVTNLLVDFKKYNENSSLIQCVMTDKDMTEQDVIKEQLPQAGLLIIMSFSYITHNEKGNIL